MNFVKTRKGIKCYEDGVDFLFRTKVSNVYMGIIYFSKRDNTYKFQPSGVVFSVDFETIENIYIKISELKEKHNL
jgi:hypothetical protein